MKLNKFFFISVLAIAVGLSISLWPIFKGIFPITFDQGRDFLWVKNQVDFKRPSLVGPWGSLSGTFMGPLWFWLLTIPYLFSHGSPLVMTLFNALIVFGSLILAAFLLFRHSKSTAYLVIILGFISPAVHGLANYPFSQHLLPGMTVLLVYSLAMILADCRRFYFFLSCFLIGLMYHAEPPMAVFSLFALAIIVYFSKKRGQILSFKTLIFGGLFFTIPFIPLIIFDSRHDFLQTRSIFSFLLGQNQTLKEIAPLSIWQRPVDRSLKLLTAFRDSTILVPLLISFFLASLVIYLNCSKLKQTFLSKFWQASFIYLLSLWIIAILYPYDFKMFYLDGVRFIFIIWMAISLNLVWQRKKLRLVVIVFLLLAFFINLCPFSFISSLKQDFTDRHYHGSLYVNKVAVIDWIYQNADQQGFQVYTFTPPIYDYDYQYMFFWYGLNQYGYLPADFSYLPDQPEYVVKKTEQLQLLQEKIRPASGLAYLIINCGSKNEKSAWWAGLSGYKLQLTKTKSFPDGTVAGQYNIANID